MRTVISRYFARDSSEMHWIFYVLAVLALLVAKLLLSRPVVSKMAVMLPGRHPILGHLKFIVDPAKCLEWVCNLSFDNVSYR
jgi:hypothetical protein